MAHAGVRRTGPTDHTGHYAALDAMLAFARRYTAQIDFSSRQSAETELARTNALREATEAEAAP